MNTSATYIKQKSKIPTLHKNNGIIFSSLVSWFARRRVHKGSSHWKKNDRYVEADISVNLAKMSLFTIKRFIEYELANAMQVQFWFFRGQWPYFLEIEQKSIEDLRKKIHRRSQKTPEGSRGSQKVRGGFRGSQNVLEGSKGSQKVLEGSKGSQKFPEDLRMF